MGESIASGGEGVKSMDDEGVNEGVKALLSAICGSSRKRANELVAPTCPTQGCVAFRNGQM